MKQRLTFIKASEVASDFRPFPATQNIPDWYIRLGNRVSNEGIPRRDNGTVKRCTPLRDALTAGYIIPTWVDVNVSTMQNGDIWYDWAAFNPISWHPIEQASTYPNIQQRVIGKWLVPWGIKTPPGYSCLFVSPMHRPNGIFSCLPGIVDTDRFNAPVNLPFIFERKGWNGLIPAGTPMVQVIPFKRDDWEHSVVTADEEISESLVRLISTFKNGYRKFFWSRKSYK